VVVPERGPLTDALTQAGVETHILPLAILHRTLSPLYWARTAARFGPTVAKLCALIRREGVRIVHSNTSHVFDGAPAARRCGVPHIWHVREMHSGRSRIGPLLRRIMTAYSDLILVVSRAVEDATFPIRPKRPPIRVLYDGIDVTRFHPGQDGTGVRTELGIGANELVIGMASRIAHWKGHRLFIEAAARVAEQHPTARFLIIGDAVTARDRRLKQELLTLRQEKGLADRMIFAGMRRDMPQVLAALDLFVLPSQLPEPWGLVTLEAMATGKPVIATRQGGPLEMLEDGITGRLTSPDRPEELTQHLLALLDDEEARRRMGEAARLACVTRFSVEQSCAEMMRLYESLLAQTQSTT
jgi:glycosyltransferase involved in cell wall biosynthesis